ncbi:MAG TPA: ribosome biogenesis GTPase Der [Holophagaceae bacterium]|nr:ribosome biogenesis GTPase Der [Holophagaceae bacterium]
MKLPLVALCGRPNVGKSTLFNRLTRSRTALVHDLPGMTRDRTYGHVTCTDEFGDPTEVFELVDTGGLDFEGDDVITAGITRMAEAAVKEAHVAVLMVDGHAGLTTGDEEIAQRLLRLGKPVILAVNKLDGMKGGAPDGAFYGLGFDEVIAISAAHGSGVAELTAAVQARLPFHRTPEEAEQHDPSEELRFALIGRPNVGKSSLTNKLLGYERSLVSEVAGTTRDTVDTVFHIEGQTYRLIDTAGIRRKGKTTLGAEKLSILKARQAMARADVSLLLIDAVEGVTHQDAVIAGYAQDAGAAVILVVNKWDLVEKDTFTALKAEEKIRYDLGFLAHAPMIFISAQSGQRVSKLFPLIRQVAEAHARRVPTGELNRFLRDAVGHMAPHAVKDKIPKLYFMTQVGVRPPTFVVKANVEELHFSYMRFLENRLRDTFGLPGTPLRLSIQKKNKGEGETEPDVAPVRKILDVGEGLKPGRKVQAKRAEERKREAPPRKPAAAASRPKPARKAPAKRAGQRTTATPRQASKKR